MKKTILILVSVLVASSIHAYPIYWDGENESEQPQPNPYEEVDCSENEYEQPAQNEREKQENNVYINENCVKNGYNKDLTKKKGQEVRIY